MSTTAHKLLNLWKYAIAHFLNFRIYIFIQQNVFRQPGVLAVKYIMFGQELGVLVCLSLSRQEQRRSGM